MLGRRVKLKPSCLRSILDEQYHNKSNFLNCNIQTDMVYSPANSSLLTDYDKKL